MREAEAERAQVGTFSAPQPEPEELPLMQQLAMLQMMNSTLARGVATRLSRINDCQDRPSFHDYRALIGRGFAYRGGEDRWHTLTVEGWAYARDMLTRLCRDNDIHVMTDHQSVNCTTYRCACGQWSTMLYGKPGIHQWRRAHSRFLSHVPRDAQEREAS